MFYFFPSEAQVGLHHLPSQQRSVASYCIQTSLCSKSSMSCFSSQVFSHFLGTLCSSLIGLLTVPPKNCRLTALYLFAHTVWSAENTFYSLPIYELLLIPQDWVQSFLKSSTILLIRINYFFLSVPHCGSVVCITITCIGLCHSCLYLINSFTHPSIHSFKNYFLNA